ncbi:SMP-30/gluconolactonase/LRE family protein [Fodinibius sediminis]|uniref:SMP-30/Gluconolaconase/LRE-like region-containing protein n=1 Tax=Fodinibius sediminis TaxID=1214077 RepID=A0A521BX71_9BACT|nr:SMP-30/gluconolactonase/LRE family protein [Fodinibius sediminis]SMO51766.1 SMP-30/Gluconolaconase/LRE-like region-containing protein [Fodinibius sediminis]
MTKTTSVSHSIFIALLFIFSSCTSETEQPAEQAESKTIQELADRVTVIDEGLAGPEAVRYDPDQDVYFISNFNGPGGEADSNGYIARARPDGTVDSLKFMTGTKEAPLHAPRGMYITGDTLLVADVKGVHSFNKRTGAQLSFTDFTEFEPGFLNDVAVDPAGVVYVTDTGQARVYQMRGQQVSIAVDTLENPPNGITFDPDSNRLVLAPWNGGRVFPSFTTENTTPQDFITVTSGGNFDGIEPYNGSFLAASQNDSSLYLISSDMESRAIIKTAPSPADIALDTKRNQVAVPYINLNRVDIWQIDQENIEQ